MSPGSKNSCSGRKSTVDRQSVRMWQHPNLMSQPPTNNVHDRHRKAFPCSDLVTPLALRDSSLKLPHQISRLHSPIFLLSLAADVVGTSLSTRSRSPTNIGACQHLSDRCASQKMYRSGGSMCDFGGGRQACRSVQDCFGLGVSGEYG